MAPLLRSQSGAHRVEGADIPHGVVSGELKVQCIVLSDTTSTATQDLEKTLLSCIFGSRLQLIRITDPGRTPGSTIHGDGANRVAHGTTFELVTSRELDGGKTFWGGTTKIVHWVYVETKGSRPNGELPPIHNLEDLLGEYAHFGALTPRKAVARLELLTSPAAGDHIHELDPDDFEVIDEPLGQSGNEKADGCGFVPQDMLDRLNLDQGACSGIQVRILIPRLGLFKGVLACKPDITKIQLVPSMRKVPPSESSARHSVALLLITKQGIFPSKANVTIGRRLQASADSTAGVKPLKTPYEKPSLGKMLQPLWEGQGVPRDAIETYKREAIERYNAAFGVQQSVDDPQSHKHWNHANVVGLRDPTGQLPYGVYIPGLPPTLLPRGRRVFVTRYPCVKPEDGRLIPVIVERPDAMSPTDWAFLSGQKFGSLYFSTAGPESIPMACAKGDLDGDLYVICWDESIIEHLSRRPELLEPFVPPPVEPKPANKMQSDGWLGRAQDHLRDPATLQEGKEVGRYCTAWQKAVKAAGPGGVADADAIALGEAFAQTLERGKHGGVINLPSHLQGRLQGSKQRSAAVAGPTAAATCSKGGVEGSRPAASLDAPMPPPTPAHTERDSLSELNLKELRQIIDDEALPVRKNVGGVGRRTKENIIAEVRSARAVKLGSYDQ